MLLKQCYDGPELPSKTLIHVYNRKEQRTFDAIAAIKGSLIYRREDREQAPCDEEQPEEDATQKAA